LLFGRLSRRDGTRGKISVARMECSDTQRQKYREGEEDDGKQPLAACHGSSPFGSMKIWNGVAVVIEV
jgi:hypothetical protein